MIFSSSKELLSFEGADPLPVDCSPRRAHAQPARFSADGDSIFMTYSQALARLLALFSMAWFTLWACAPMMSAPPSPPIPSDYSKEFGLGLNAGVGTEDFFELPRDCGYLEPAAVHSPEYDECMSPIRGGLRVVSQHAVGSVQLWQRFQVGARRHNEMGLLLQAGMPTLLSGGAYFRINANKGGPLQVGHQFEAGGMWFGYSLPIAVPLGDKAWLTTKPAIRASAFSKVQLPVGFSIELGKRARLDAEVGVHAGGTGDVCTPHCHYMMYGGLALSHHFGKPTRPFRTSTPARKKPKLVPAFLPGQGDTDGRTAGEPLRLQSE